MLPQILQQVSFNNRRKTGINRKEDGTTVMSITNSNTTNASDIELDCSAHYN